MYSKLISISVAVACWYSSSSINAVATQRLFQGLLSSSLLQDELDDLGATVNAEVVQRQGVILMSALLTLSQLIMGGIMGLALLYILGGQPAVVSSSQQFTGTSTPRNHHVLDFHQQIQRQDILIGLFHCIGCICTNMGFGYGSASLVQIVKLLEPIETLLLSALVRKSFEVLSFRKFSSIVFISAGTYMLLSNTSTEAKPRSIIFAIASGFCMASRNVLSKEREKGLGVAQSVSPEGSSEANFKEMLRKGIKKFAYITIMAAIFAFILALIIMFRSLYLLKLMLPPLMKISPIILSETIIFHCLYNMASITVLSLTSAPSHSLLNVGKRIVNVIIASVAFNVAIPSSGKVGLVVAFIGGCIYNEKIASIMKEVENSRINRRTLCGVFVISCMMLQKFYFLSSMQFSFDAVKDDAPLPRKTQFLFQESKVIDDRSSSRTNKVILLGPHDRYNFGDLIFSKVVAKLLTSRAGYSHDEILYGGLISVNMSAYGGPPSVLSMKQIQSLSRNDDIHGPYDIIFTGGEVMGCSHDCGVGMMPTPEFRTQAKREKVYECAYVFPKHLLLPVIGKSLNYAVGNSLGGATRGKNKACRKGIDTADHAVWRDGNPLYPDSAVMMKELFANEINEAANDVLQDLFPTKTGNGRKFVAVHSNGGRLASKAQQMKLASGLDEVSRELNATMIFFAAGTAPHHDSFDAYEAVASFMKEEAIVYKAENMWKVIGLISRAEAVLSTSLHVRIMAFIYLKPRLTWCSEGQKHSDFIAKWDTNTSTPCVSDETMTWDVLRQHYYTDPPEMSRASTTKKYDETVQMYLESFSDYSALLRPPVQ